MAYGYEVDSIDYRVGFASSGTINGLYYGGVMSWIDIYDGSTWTNYSCATATSPPTLYIKVKNKNGHTQELKPEYISSWYKENAINDTDISVIHFWSAPFNMSALNPHFGVNVTVHYFYYCEPDRISTTVIYRFINGNGNNNTYDSWAPGSGTNFWYCYGAGAESYVEFNTATGSTTAAGKTSTSNIGTGTRFFQRAIAICLNSSRYWTVTIYPINATTGFQLDSNALTKYAAESGIIHFGSTFNTTYSDRSAGLSWCTLFGTHGGRPASDSINAAYIISDVKDKVMKMLSVSESDRFKSLDDYLKFAKRAVAFAVGIASDTYGSYINCSLIGGINVTRLYGDGANGFQYGEYFKTVWFLYEITGEDTWRKLGEMTIQNMMAHESNANHFVMGDRGGYNKTSDQIQLLPSAPSGGETGFSHPDFPWIRLYDLLDVSNFKNMMVYLYDNPVKLDSELSGSQAGGGRWLSNLNVKACYFATAYLVTKNNSYQSKLNTYMSQAWASRNTTTNIVSVQQSVTNRWFDLSDNGEWWPRALMLAYICTGNSTYKTWIIQFYSGLIKYGFTEGGWQQGSNYIFTCVNTNGTLKL